MKVALLIAREAVHRRLQTILALVAASFAVALPVAFFTTGEAAGRETRVLMRDMGYNLRIIPRETDMERFWRDGYSELTLSDEGVARFAERGDLSFNHLIAMLQRRVDWEGAPVLLTGIATEVSPRGKKQGSMLFEVETGSLHVGWEPARRLGLEEGQAVRLLGREFRVERCLVETGTGDDARVWAALTDAQSLLGLEGRINEVKALDCFCGDPAVDSRERLRSQLEEVIPDGKVIRLQAVAEARQKQRRMAQGWFALIMPAVLVACAASIGFLALLNARERRGEIGILRALGHGSGRIAALFLGKAVLIGVLGALLGFLAGTALALEHGPEIFQTTAKSIRPSWTLLGQALVLTPLFTALVSLIPALLATTEDPARCLRAEG